MPVASIGSATAGVRVGLTGALAVAGSVASLGGLNIKGCLGTDETDDGIDADGAGAGVRPLSSAPRENFCRDRLGAVWRGLRVLSLTDDVGVGFRFVLILA